MLFIFQARESDLWKLRLEVLEALDISRLVQALQEERTSLALKNNLLHMDKNSLSIWKKEVQGINHREKNAVKKMMNLTDTMANTDKVLVDVSTDAWPDIPEDIIDKEKWPAESISYFKSKLTFQKQLGIFRSRFETKDLPVFEILQWYDTINEFILDYIAYSIHVSEVGGFYQYVIFLQDLLRATEYAGASGLYAINYYVSGQLSKKNRIRYIMLDSLQASGLDLSKSDWLRYRHSLANQITGSGFLVAMVLCRPTTFDRPTARCLSRRTCGTSRTIWPRSRTTRSSASTTEDGRTSR